MPDPSVLLGDRDCCHRLASLRQRFNITGRRAPNPPTLLPRLAAPLSEPSHTTWLSSLQPCRWIMWAQLSALPWNRS